ncbi:Endothelin-converting enzyme 1 [Gracilariopsis chorda]|uniref:Endothelin-converting enzyme 1 n=1 Tax=Gracilariopsis chorda TaxID=448386 RepID=A0A2V3J168_9FLOR|nr:Endothelin-converting enzyme 1 [Gracilariopsis chorda]|eukprot:PXF48151.1 Endothelin-converting enzyme 1 [Gracilariopsis chorda]
MVHQHSTPLGEPDSSPQRNVQTSYDDNQHHFPRSPNGYAQISSRSDEEIDDHSSQLNYQQSELDPLNFPPAPPGYYRRDVPMRITHYGKLFVVLLAVALACIAIAAVIDVSSPSNFLEPGRDQQSVADTVLAAMDRSADPCEDFYEYACGSWLRTAKIPTDRTQYSKSFSVVYDMIQWMVKELLDTQNAKQASKPAMFYASCFDQMGVGGLNTLYLQPFRDDFNSLRTSVDFARLMARVHTRSALAFFDIEVSLDEKNTSRYAFYMGQGGLGLPHRDDYLKGTDREVEMRAKYVKLMEAMLNIAGKARLIPRKGNDLLARKVLTFETALANHSLPPEELRNPEKMYNKMSIEHLPKFLHFKEYMKTLDISEQSLGGTVILDNVPFFKVVSRILQAVDSESDMRTVARGYLAFHLVRHAASEGLLGENAYHENYKFKQLVYGLKQLPDKWKYCQTLTNRHLGEAVGAAFVEKHFTESRKNVAVDLAKEISTSFAHTLESETWMDKATREAALEKLAAINWKVGYSEKLDTYDDVEISKSFQENVASATAHKWRKRFNRLGNPVDKTEWFMNPHEVNAYYSVTRNEMVFPAGILQQPFFSDAYPEAMNYGSIGAIIGHEMSHGFDDQGRQYDKDGMLTPWWSNSSISEYKEKAKCYIDLFDTYKPRDVDIHVRGNLTLGENLADTNGVNVAFRAFKSRPNNTEDGIPPPNALLARELTNDQLFFVAYAQSWCTLYRREALKVDIMTDPHSPGKFRTLGPLSQSSEFATAFSCRNGSRYNPTTRCNLW